MKAVSKFLLLSICICFANHSIAQDKTVVLSRKAPYIVNGNYKDSYSIGFMCRLEAVVHGNTEAIFTGCDVGTYSDGYEDGYNGREEKYLKIMIVKTVVKGILVVSAILTNSTPEEDAPLTSQASNFSVEEISYKNGYSDGHKDRRKEEADIAEGQRQGRKIIYAGKNEKFKEMFKN